MVRQYELDRPDKRPKSKEYLEFICIDEKNNRISLPDKSWLGVLRDGLWFFYLICEIGRHCRNTKGDYLPKYFGYWNEAHPLYIDQKSKGKKGFVVGKAIEAIKISVGSKKKLNAQYISKLFCEDIYSRKRFFDWSSEELKVEDIISRLFWGYGRGKNGEYIILTKKVIWESPHECKIQQKNIHYSKLSKWDVDQAYERQRLDDFAEKHCYSLGNVSLNLIARVNWLDDPLTVGQVLIHHEGKDLMALPKYNLPSNAHLSNFYKKLEKYADLRKKKNKEYL